MVLFKFAIKLTKVERYSFGNRTKSQKIAADALTMNAIFGTYKYRCKSFGFTTKWQLLLVCSLALCKCSVYYMAGKVSIV